MKIKDKKTAQEVQDENFRKMSTDQKIKLVSDFSMFLLSLNQLARNYEFPRTNRPSRQDSKQA